MGKLALARRYAIEAVGVFFLSLGIAFLAKAGLGATPISGIPYSLVLIWPQLTYGTWVFLFNILLITVQVVLALVSHQRLIIADLVLEVVICVGLGSLVDVSMLLLTWLNPTFYPAQVLWLVVGCAVLAFATYLQVIADVVMAPGDALARVIMNMCGKRFGTVRTFSDTTMALIAAALCLVFLHNLSGVREGTVLAALIIGPMTNVFIRLFAPLTRILLPEGPLRKEGMEAEMDGTIPDREQ